MKTIQSLTRAALVVSIILLAQTVSFAQWITTGTTIHNNPLTNSVGVGINATQFGSKLHVNGNLVVGNFNTKAQISGAGFSGAIEIKSDVSNTGSNARYLRLGVKRNDLTFAPSLSIIDNGFIGLGTTNPTYPLEIVGNTKLVGSLVVGDFNTVNKIAGSGYSGAIEFKSDVSTGGADSRYLRLGMQDNIGNFYPRLSIIDNGNVGIGTNNPQSLLAVAGKITSKEVQVTLSGWSDYVFQSSYHLRPLSEVESFVKENKHLPEIPSAAEVEKNGINLGEMDALLLKKIEELTLYVIDLKKEVEVLKNENLTLKNK